MRFRPIFGLLLLVGLATVIACEGSPSQGTGVPGVAPQESPSRETETPGVTPQESSSRETETHNVAPREPSSTAPAPTVDGGKIPAIQGRQGGEPYAPETSGTPAVEANFKEQNYPTKEAPLQDGNYLTEDIPPCTPVEGFSVNPCDSDAPQFDMGIAQYVPDLGGEPLSIRELLDDGPSPAWVTHLILRGTYLPGTVRCTAGDLFRPPAYLQGRFRDTTNEQSIKCYIDVRANAYVLGSGPSTVTILLLSYGYGRHEEELRQQFEMAIDDMLPGREHVMGLGPPVDLSSEAWRFLGYWDVQREDGSVIAVHPNRDLWQRLRPDDYVTHRSALEMELPTFTQAVTAAHEARVTEYDGRIGEDEDLPDLVTNANNLRDYYIEVGAYDEGEPTPAQPPPPCGLSVTNQFDNPMLIRDCEALLASKDTLRGTGALNWATGTAITTWEGITVAGTPQRVTKLKLADKSLTGTIPERLADLDGLTEIKLAGNTLTGCIPVAWRAYPLATLAPLGSRIALLLLPRPPVDLPLPLAPI